METHLFDSPCEVATFESSRQLVLARTPHAASGAPTSVVTSPDQNTSLHRHHASQGYETHQ